MRGASWVFGLGRPFVMPAARVGVRGGTGAPAPHARSAGVPARQRRAARGARLEQIEKVLTPPKRHRKRHPLPTPPLSPQMVDRDIPPLHGQGYPDQAGCGQNTDAEYWERAELQQRAGDTFPLVAGAGVSFDNECFFIAPIGADGSPERKRSDGVLEFIVARAADELGLTAVRADQIAEPGQITLQVIDHVLGAKGAVVDLTGLNPNVFYELAVRHTARLPVALIAEKDCKLPFDIAQMRTIFFDHTDLASADSCRREIVNHLGEAIDGAVDSPIATSVDVRAMQAGSVVERSLAEVVTTLEDLGRGQRIMLDHVNGLTHDLRVGTRIPERPLRDLIERLNVLRHVVEVTGDPELVEAMESVDEVSNYLTRRLIGTRSRAGRANVVQKPSPEEFMDGDDLLTIQPK